MHGRLLLLIVHTQRCSDVLGRSFGRCRNTKTTYDYIFQICCKHQLFQLLPLHSLFQEYILERNSQWRLCWTLSHNNAYHTLAVVSSKILWGAYPMLGNFWRDRCNLIWIIFRPSIIRMHRLFQAWLPLYQAYYPWQCYTQSCPNTNNSYSSTHTSHSSHNLSLQNFPAY